MVLEDLIPVHLAESNPLTVLPISFLYSTLAIFLALWIFPANAAIVAVFLTTIACMPLLLSVIGFEKEKSESSRGYLKDLLTDFFKGDVQEGGAKTVLSFFMTMFIGLTLAITFWYTVLPKDMLVNLFYLQLNTIKEINLGISGNAIVPAFFGKILVNNIKVLAFSILFSFIYGAGAIFVISWNSSIIGVAMGESIRKGIAQFTESTGFGAIAGYSSAISVGIFRYMLHGVPEILAFFVGALAGSLISVAIVRHEYDSEMFRKTLTNSAGLLGVAMLLLLIGAVIEVTISPLIRL
ncbi:MAG: stage II sporulation protein M [archaeon]